MKFKISHRKLWGIVAFISPLLLYCLTLCPTVYVGDSGELATEAYNLEIGHPPGYPLLTNVAHIWSHALFFLRPILALNLFAACCGAAAAAILFLTIRRIFKDDNWAADVIAYALSLTFALGITTWSAATAYEVHALAVLITIAIMYSTFRFLQTGDLRIFYLACYLLGLALCNHLSSLALVPLVALSILFRTKRFKLASVLFGMSLVLIPLSFYFYMYVRSRFDIVLAWYSPHNWAGLKQQIFAETYQRYLASPRLVDLSPYIHQVWRILSQEFYFPLVLLAIPGFVLLIRRDTRLALVTASVLLANCLLNFNYVIPDISPYYLPTIVILIYWTTELFAQAVEHYKKLSLPIAMVASIIVVIVLFGNYKKSDISNHRGAENYALDLFERTPQGGILFCGSDNSMFPAFYLHYVEKYRPDCRVYGHLPTLSKFSHDLGLDSTAGNWNKFPELLRYLVRNDHPPLVFAREPMQITNDFKEILPDLRADGLVNYLEGDTHPALVKTKHFDWRNIPDLYDPKEAAMYAVYLLINSESAATLGDPDAKELLKRAVKLIEQTENSVMLGAIASYFVISDSLDEARGVIEKALSLPEMRFDERMRLMLPLGKIYLRLGDTRKAETVLNQVVVNDPENKDAQFHLLSVKSASLVGEKKWQDAINTYLKMRTLSPEQLEVSLQLGLLYLRIGDTTSARKEFVHCRDAGYKKDQVDQLIGLIDNPPSGHESN